MLFGCGAKMGLLLPSPTSLSGGTFMGLQNDISSAIYLKDYGPAHTYWAQIT